MRRVLVVVGCVLAVAGVAACSPAVQGISGVRLDPAGNLVAVLGLCSDFGTPETMSLYPVGEDGELGSPLTFYYTGAAPESQFVEVPLADPPSGWQAKRAMPAPDPARTYELRAWGSNNGRVRSFPFQLSELTAPPPSSGPILNKLFVGGDEYDTSYLTPDEFRALTGRECEKA